MYLLHITPNQITISHAWPSKFEILITYIRIFSHEYLWDILTIIYSVLLQMSISDVIGWSPKIEIPFLRSFSLNQITLECCNLLMRSMFSFNISTEAFIIYDYTTINGKSQTNTRTQWWRLLQFYLLAVRFYIIINVCVVMYHFADLCKFTVICNLFGKISISFALEIIRVMSKGSWVTQRNQTCYIQLCFE